MKGARNCACESASNTCSSAGTPAWRAGREHVLDGYLRGDVKDHRPPRFFLNDVIRYWRTITVDFVGKERAGGGADRMGGIGPAMADRAV